MTAPSTPRWGRQVSIIQPRQPAFWLYCAMLAIGGYLFIQEESLMSSLMPAFALSWALVLVYAVPVALAIYWLDLFEREPKLMLAAAVIWGGVIATSLAAYANEAWLSVLGKMGSPEFVAAWGTAIVGPGVEETLKLMGVVVLFLMASAEFDGVLDGFVYGAMVGLGFTVVEDVSYFIRHVVDAASPTVDQAGPVIDTFLIRVVGGGLYGHVLFTGLTGTGFAYLVTKRSTPMPGRIAGATLCMAAGVTAHVVWNSPWMESVLGSDPSVLQWIEYGAIKGMPFLILLGILVVLATRSEESNFRAIVAGEPDAAVITDDEVRSLRSLWTRRSARSAAGRLRGPAARRLTGRLQSAQIEYAMIRSRSDSLTDPALDVQRNRVRSIRAELAALPAVPASVPASVQWAAPKPVWGQPTGGTPWPGHAPAPNSLPAAVSSALPVAEPVPEPAATLAAQPAAAEPAVEPAVDSTPVEPSPTSAYVAPPTPPTSVPVWAPSHVVPAGGLPAWDAPEPAREPVAILSERVELVVLSRAGAWAQVRGVNGWTGWVDGRRIVERRRV
jgi:RsiW-degrading membrane proteinase PrsW (M82 family)